MSLSRQIPTVMPSKAVIFDDDARREFLTGFHKRKLAKIEAAKKRSLEREKQERLQARREASTLVPVPALSPTWPSNVAR